MLYHIVQHLGVRKYEVFFEHFLIPTNYSYGPTFGNQNYLHGRPHGGLVTS